MNNNAAGGGNGNKDGGSNVGAIVAGVAATVGAGYMLFKWLGSGESPSANPTGGPPGGPSGRNIHVGRVKGPKSTVRSIFSEYDVDVIDNSQDAIAAVHKLQMFCQDFPVLGFDCEGFHNGRKMALLQLANHKDYCAVFDLHQLNGVPSVLQRLLEDRSVMKVGIGSTMDVDHLKRMFDVNVEGWLDLRHVARELDHTPNGLKLMAQIHLDITLTDVDPLTVEWSDRPLSVEVLQYAADDAIAGVKIYQKFVQQAGQGQSYKCFDGYVEQNFQSILPRSN